MAIYDLQMRDFYFGACMFSFFKHNQDTTPSLIENMEDIQVIKMTTNTSDDFYIIMKYTKNSKSRKTIYKSWTFPITNKDRDMIEKYYSICENIYLFFVCGEVSYTKAPKNINNDRLYIEEVKSGRIAIYRYCDYLKVKDKDCITINIYNPREHSFSLFIDSKDNVIKSKCNNIEKKISDIIII